MATGVTKNERLGRDAISATRGDCSLLPLPPVAAGIELAYSGKCSESQILACPDFAFRTVSRAGEASLQTRSLSANSFVLADNILGLHALIESGNRATLIYLDPPYGTGMDFHSRELEHAYSDALGSAAYAEFIRRRLILARECMTEDGSIYVHIGHQMLSTIKLLMDEIFGADNFRNLITRRKCSSKNFTRKQYANLNDFILFYSKSKNYKWTQPGVEPEKDWIEREYPKIDPYGRRYKLVPIHAPGTRNGETGKPWRGVLPPKGKHWQYAPSKLEELDVAGDIHWSRNANPRRKVYLSADKKVGITDYWEKFRDAHHQSILITGYPTEKNLDMLKMIVETSSEKGDLVVDPFCGSGTTIHAARTLGRSFVGIDASVSAAKATLARMRHGLSPMGDYVNKKTNGQRFLELDLALQKVEFIVDNELWLKEEDAIRELAKI